MKGELMPVRGTLVMLACEHKCSSIVARDQETQI